MSDAISSKFTSSYPKSYPNYGTSLQGNSGNAPSLYQLGVASQTELHIDANIAPILSFQPFDEMALGPDKTAVELGIRQLRQEINHAREELKDLEESLVQDLMKPPLREWLFPLMSIGLAISLYGSFSSNNTTELGATGLMLLWSLSAFWYIHARDSQSEQAKIANRAEIEIWSSRIAELEKSLEQTPHTTETAERNQLS
jgi:hypothetical protein